MVGGAPVTKTYSERIGADIYAPDAMIAAKLARTAAREKRRPASAGTR
jgi:methanogenic corrinoid protein MtbC1